MKNILSFIAIIVMLLSCDTSKKPDANQQTSTHKVTVQEVIQVTGYTYMRVTESGNEKWLAGPTAAVEIGKDYYYENSMEMKNFESKELGRSFETIYFISKISSNPEGSDQVQSEMLHDPNKQQNLETPKPVIEKNEIKVEVVSGGITIAELMENKEKYEGKIVKLKGIVTKYNPAIMGVNWFHIQDGTDFNGEFDLTVTTSAEVKLDEVVTFQGKVTLDKDFGAGYFYAIIIENAELIK